MKLHDFLVEHAKFPFPHPEFQIADTTEISELEIGLLEREWKARDAVRDHSLVQKLCRSFENILGDTPLSEGTDNYLLPSFAPLLKVDERGRVNRQWIENSSKARSKSLLDKGFFEAARRCLEECGPYHFDVDEKHSFKGGSSKVDYVARVNNRPKVLCEATSPSVMKDLDELLPPHGIELKWVTGQSLVPKILSQAALYLGLRKMEWLFLSCHNYWIVCRLVRDDDHPYLAYSPVISIEDSSVPFRAFLGAILSVIKGVGVDRSAYSSELELDTIEEKAPFSNSTTDDSRRCAYGEHENTDSGLFVTLSSPTSPEDFQVWVHLHSMSNNTLVLPQRARGRKQRLWLTRFIASGWTSNVWECRFDNYDKPFAVKVVETLDLSDVDSRQRLHNEFNIYLTMEKAYRSGRLRDRITPRCYGAFKGDQVDVLILDLCDGILNDWSELNAAERSQIYQLVQDLHRIGIAHGDLEPRNIGRARSGGFCLIDFSESRKHRCKENKVVEPGSQVAPARNEKCYELQTLRNCLWKRQPIGPHVDLG